MKWLDLSDIKAQCRIDGNQEDTLLTSYGKAAEEGILNLCNRSYEDICEQYGEFPESLKIASLLLTEHLYTHRGPTENISLSVIPYGVDFWVKNYMKLTIC